MVDRHLDPHASPYLRACLGSGGPNGAGVGLPAAAVVPVTKDRAYLDSPPVRLLDAA